MKRMNNRGFAVSGIIYGILIIFLLLVFSMLAMLISRENIMSKIKDSASDIVLGKDVSSLPAVDRIQVPFNSIYVSPEGINLIQNNSYDLTKLAISAYNEDISLDTSACDFSTMATTESSCKIKYYLTNDSSIFVEKTLKSISLAPTQDYTFTNSKQDLTLDKGVYDIQLWGASGADMMSIGGRYAEGVLGLYEMENAYLYVGGIGQKSSDKLSLGGFNGGGNGGSYSSGGGATDIRLKEDSLYSRIIVAGGGGGGENFDDDFFVYSKFYTDSGINDVDNNAPDAKINKIGRNVCNINYSSCLTAASNASFGQGGGATPTYYRIAGGGGGFYGGGYLNVNGQSYNYSSYNYAGCGSSFVYTVDNARYVPDGWLLDRNYYLISGFTDITKYKEPTGEIVDGHYGNGYARINKYIYFD